METKLIDAGVKNLRTFGYPGADKDNILTDPIYRAFFSSMLTDPIYRAFFSSMLTDNKGLGGKDADAAIDALLARCGL